MRTWKRVSFCVKRPSGAVGVPESRLELELSLPSLAAWEEFLARIDRQAHLSAATAGEQSGTPRAERSGSGIDPCLRSLRRIGREDLQHAAGRVAVEHGQRAAQHLDALDRRKADARSLALPVGHRQRDAVDDQAHAPDAEACARTEPADRDLQILRLVLLNNTHQTIRQKLILVHIFVFVLLFRIK